MRPGNVDEVSQAARKILEAVQREDISALESALDQARLLPGQESENEHLDLLGAVVVQLRNSFLRRRRQATYRLEGVEVHLQLLRHVAGQGRAGIRSSQGSGAQGCAPEA